jgi:CHAD domain-containing protein
MRPHRPVDLGHALQRALVQALAKLAAALAQADMSEADVHRARRAAKRARALARLAPGALAAHAQRTIEIARQARRGLGGPRDAAVRRATLAKLRKRLGPAHERLAGALDDPAPPAADDRDGLRIALGALIHEWRAATMSDAGDEILRRVTKGYRKARRRAPHHGASAQELHRWRAAVVDHEYQTDFLKDCSRFAARQSDSADELRRRLGEAHDIDALLGFAEASEDAALNGSHEALAAAAAPRRNKRAAAARRLGEKMFGRKPRKWAKRLRRSVLPSDG